MAEDVEWAGAGTNLRSFVYTFSGAAGTAAPAFSHRIVLSLVCRAIQVVCPCFPKIEI